MKTIATNGAEIKTGNAVLVRNNYKETWKYSFFSHKEANSYVTCGFHYLCCIPYKGNECLAGTTGDFAMPDKFTVYARKQKEWIKKNNIKVGDKVKITKKVNSLEDGWGCHWNGEMNSAVGKCGKIISIDDEEEARNTGILIIVDGYDEYWYPYFILEKVEKEFEFRFGAKVKGYGATEACNNNKIGILIDQDKDDPYYTYKVAFPINDNTEGNTDWFSEIEYLD